MPVGPGPESVGISLYAVDPNAGKWDKTTWDGGYWGAVKWNRIDCDVTEVTTRWGATDEAGILSLVSAGELDVTTFDPDRTLDPTNAASPFYGAVRPGTPVRVVGLAPGEIVAGTAIIDDATYDLAAAAGRIRAVDGIAYLGQAQVPDGTALPNTMRARTRAVVAAVGLASLIPVEPEAATDPDVDPPVAPHDGIAAPAWEIIARAAEDSLTIVWLDPAGTLRFRSWGALPDSGVNLGCPDVDSADELWLPGLSTILTTASAGPVRNSVRAYSSGTVWQPARVDPISKAKYGPRPFDVERVVPDFANWGDRILADRADSGLEIAIGEVRPFDVPQLAALLSLTGPATVRVRDDEHGDLLDFDAGVIGATIAVTANGWRWQLVTTVPRVQWDDVAPIPPEPPIPPPDPWHVETRTYIATSDALLALTSGGAKYGAGAATSLPVGGWQGWTYRSCAKFPTIPFTKVRAVRSATLGLRTTTQVRIGFGSNPKLELRRITSSWSAGSSSSPSSGNAVVWPGPSTTTSGAKTSTMPGGQNVDKAIDVTAIVKAWGPTSIGGSAAPQYGIELREISGSETYTTEVWPMEQGGAARPVLTVVVEVFD